MTLMSYTPEPAIWSYDTGQWTPCIDSCQLTLMWMPSIKEVRVSLFLMWATYVLAVLAVMTIMKTQVNNFPISLDFLWLWGFTLRPFGPLWSSAKNILIVW